jgi:3'-phosphoadenosine 5'-phosphosulfate sulfotransferase (PAPS reductase)/FAD synthetase
MSPTVATTPEIDGLLSRDCVVAVGVSGGKDSQACALAVASHLDAIGHRGRRVLIHADLGRIEWAESLPVCERLAAHLGWELLVVRRKAGDMIDRWRGRWTNNVARYAKLECVKLILPWSTPSMRFCTSEMKVDQITAALRKRWPHEAIVNVAGIRRQESANRSRMPVAAPLAKLQRKNAVGVSWNAIIDWTIEQVFALVHSAGLSLHDAYTVWRASRVSCSFCIMSTLDDMLAAAGCDSNGPSLLNLVDLEASSTFGFQGARWLADVAPHLLPQELVARVAQAKAAAAVRIEAESAIPRHLLYTAGWPAAMPTREEAELIAAVRCRVADAVGIEVGYRDGPSVLARYAELMAQAQQQSKAAA